MTTEPTEVELRQCALAVSVLDDIDIEPAGDGLRLPGAPVLDVAWWEVRRALAGTAPTSTAGHRLLARWLHLRRRLAERTLPELAEMARPVGVPTGDSNHPGVGWVRMRVLGDTLDLGLGFIGLDPAAPDRVVVVPQGMLDAAGIAAGAWWPAAHGYLERMGALAAARWQRNPSDVVRPMGDCDVVTLLGSAALRAAICTGPSGGMRAVVVPMRARGWLDLSRIDPAFAIAAYAATDPEDRGFERGLLITRDEVVMTPAGGRPHEIVLRDPAAEQAQHRRPMLYRSL